MNIKHNHGHQCWMTALAVTCMVLAFSVLTPLVALAHYDPETDHQGYHFSEEEGHHYHTCTYLFGGSDGLFDTYQRTSCEWRRLALYTRTLLDKYDSALQIFLDKLDKYDGALHTFLDKYDSVLQALGLLFLFYFLSLLGFVGGTIGAKSGRAWRGFFLGLIFGPLGWYVILPKRKVKDCPHCKESVLKEAVICRFCHSGISENTT